MIKYLILFLFILSSSWSYSQTKFLIYFKDKSAPQGERLNKAMPEYSEALNSLSPKAIERRIKTAGEDNIVTWEDLPIRKEYEDQIKGLGIKTVRELKWFNAVSAFLSEEQLQYVRTLPFVKRVEKVKYLHPGNEQLLLSPFNKIAADELNYGNSFTQDNLSSIPQVHREGINGEGVLVGLLDTGFDWRDHESLHNRNVIAEYDFIFDDSTTSDQAEDLPGQQAHGTAVFSVIGGYKDSMLIGPAYNSSFILAKTEDIRSETRVEEDNYAAALEWMEAKGVDITSSSLGYSDFDNFTYTYPDMNGNTAIVTKAVNIAFSKGVVTVTAAGNEGNTPWHYITAPADAFNIIAVGSVSADNGIAASSSRGPTYDGRIKPEVVAMGVSVFAASHTGYSNYGFSSGTSLATPLASGVAALLLSAYPHLTNTQVRSILMETGDNASSPDNDRGYGLISAPKAVSFPNLQISSGSTIMHKMFIGEGVVPSTVKLFYAAGTNEYTEAYMIQNGRAYTYTMPVFASGKFIDFYFTYTDSSGNNKREPSQNSYSYKAGDLIVNLNITNIPSDYVLSQNYPNPFNSTTRIDFVSSGNERAELIVVDGSGQKVKTLFNGISEKGVNTVTWDGKSDRGYICASGVYYYMLKLAGSDYGRKMILLK